MIAALLILPNLLASDLGQPAGPTLASLDDLAQKRNVAALEDLLTGPKRRVSPFRVLATNGPYDGGRFGWRAIGMHTPDGRDLVVFSTSLTMQDTGELVFERQGGKLAYIPEDDSEHVRILNHKFKVKFEPTAKNVEVEDDIQFESQTGAGNGFLVRLGSEYQVSKVTDHEGNILPFTQAGGVVALKRPNAMVFALRFTYAGTVDKPNYGGSISGREASLADDYWYPTIARQPSTYDIELRAPQPWTCVAQGDLVSEKDEANWHIVNYHMAVPTVYFSISAAPYRMAIRAIDGRKYTVYSVARPASEFSHQAEYYDTILRFYESKFGKYPFQQWGAVISTVYGSGALEAYSFATYGNEVPGEDPHETAHTWWGGIVPNSYLHSLWNESFAVFCEGLFRREVNVGNQEERRLAFISTPQTSSEFEEAPCEESGVEIGPAASSLGYGKGSYVLQMLETEIGTERMIASMKSFFDERPKDRSAEWSDFEAAVGRVTGDPHKAFFDQWLRRTGWAKPKISDVSLNGDAVSGKIAFDGPRYDIPIEAMLQYADGHREFTTIDTSKDSFTLPVHGKAVLLSVDPWRRVLRQIAPNEAPVGILGFRGKVFRDGAYKEYRPDLGAENSAADFGGVLSGSILVGHPDTFPAMRELCEKVGFKVVHNSLTYKGTTVDLNSATASAVVDLPGGGHCMIALGRSDVPPNPGRARLALCDNLGRFLRGETEPKTGGNLTFKL